MYNYILAYLIGTFPSGLIVAKIFNVDLKSSGSGNPGATNVARIIGKKAGIITLVFDVLKGLLACTLPGNIFALGFLAVCGHCFSIPKLLKGGKGVATSLGVLLAVDYRLALISVAIFGLSFYFSRIVSLSSIVSAISIIPLSIFFFGLTTNSLFLAGTAIIIVARHYQNISRLLQGTEAKFVAKS